MGKKYQNPRCTSSHKYHKKVGKKQTTKNKGRYGTNYGLFGQLKTFKTVADFQVSYSHDQVMSKLPESYQKVARKLPETCEKVVRKL